MNQSLKLAILLLGSALLCVSGSASARASDYPSRPVRIIVPYPAGGGTDIAARIIAQKLSDRLKQQVFVDNRAGANGNLGTELIAKAAPDGYTLGMATPGPVTVGRSLYPTLPYDPAKDLTPIINANSSPIVLVVNPSLKVSSLKELVALAKQNPGKLTAALVSTGSVPHLVTEMFKQAAGVNILDIPYKGGAPATLDVMNGQVNMLFSVLPLVLPNIRAGQLKVLAIASPKRSSLIPNVPTTAEQGYPDVVGSAWNGIVGPNSMPPEIVRQLNSETEQVLRSKDVDDQFAKLGMEPLGGSPKDFSSFLASESQKWAGVIKAAHIGPQ